MATVNLRYVDCFRDANGVLRYYFRRSRKHKRMALPGLPGEPEFMRAYELAYAESGGAKAPRTNAPLAGSFDALAALYVDSASFRLLSAKTRPTYQGIIRRFLATEASNGQRYGVHRIAGMKSRHVRTIINDKFKLSGPSAANNLLKVLRVMLTVAVDSDWCAENPAAGVKPVRFTTDGFITWSEDDIAKFEKHHPSGSRARLALYLLLYTGQRRGDVVEMGRQHVHGDLIRVRQNKTKVRLAIPMHKKLRAEIEASAATDNLTFILTQWGRPFTVAGFGNWFRDVCDEAGLTGRSAHGLRKAAARRLADAGCTPHQIMAITGHKSLAEVTRYTAAADQERMAREAMRRIEED